MANLAANVQARPLITINEGYLKVGEKDCPDVYPIDRAISFWVSERSRDVNILVGTYMEGRHALYQVQAMDETDTLVNALFDNTKATLNQSFKSIILDRGKIDFQFETDSTDKEQFLRFLAPRFFPEDQFSLEGTKTGYTFTATEGGTSEEQTRRIQDILHRMCGVISNHEVEKKIRGDNAFRIDYQEPNPIEVSSINHWGITHEGPTRLEADGSRTKDISFAISAWVNGVSKEVCQKTLSDIEKISRRFGTDNRELETLLKEGADQQDSPIPWELAERIVSLLRSSPPDRNVFPPGWVDNDELFDEGINRFDELTQILAATEEEKK